MTVKEIERIAVLETEVKALTKQVESFDKKLDTITEYITREQAKGDVTGAVTQFRRWLIPLVVSISIVAVNIAMKILGV